MNSGYRNLLVWQKAKTLADSVYRLTSESPASQDYGLRDQLQRSAVSIASNIAEGDERNTNKDSIRFLYISKGSCAELITQLEIANEVYCPKVP